MIGNTDDLRGVPVDMNDYYYFFLSPAGGNWRSDEIDILMNPTRRELRSTIREIENADYDYLITIFSGHGCESDGETILGLNGQGETITMSELTNLSPKQLLLLDCCRGSALMPEEIAFLESLGITLSISCDTIRQAYECRIEDSAPQEVILFACDEGEPANDTPAGATYAQYLLDATQNILTYSSSPFVDVSRAHQKAASLMRQDPAVDQHPQILQSHCPPGRRLPLAVNPKFW